MAKEEYTYILGHTLLPEICLRPPDSASCNLPEETPGWRVFQMICSGDMLYPRDVKKLVFHTPAKDYLVEGSNNSIADHKLPRHSSSSVSGRHLPYGDPYSVV
jgi:hypothetical protein